MSNGIEKPDFGKLDAQQTLFVELVTDPFDTRSVGEKGVQAGYSEKYGYELRRKLDAYVIYRLDDIRRSNDLLHQQAFYKCFKRAMDDSRPDCGEHMRMYFQASGVIGSGGSTTNVNVQQNNASDDTLEERMKQLERRERALVPEGQE